MLVLLPPSEGKTPPLRGRPLAWRSLGFPTLSPLRRALLAAVAPELARAPAAPAIDVYSGVLYGALDAGTLPPAQRERLEAGVVISSALFGLLRPGDRIPAYRLPPSGRVAGFGPLPGMWRDEVSDALTALADDGPVLDLRSGAYQAMGRPPAEVTTVARVLLERNGRRSVVSHHNKATKGRAVRALLASRRAHRTIEDVAHTLESHGMHCELHGSSRGAMHLDIVTTHL